MSDIRQRSLEIYYKGKAATFLVVLYSFCYACNSAVSSKNTARSSNEFNNLNDTLNNNRKQKIIATQSQSDTSIDHQSDNNYVNDTFVNSVLDNTLSYKAINRYSANDNTLIKKLKKNEIFFIRGGDSIVFLKGTSAIVLESATIFSNAIFIDKSIKIGTTKNTFGKKFETSIPDTFRLNELEGNCQFTFIFKNDTLYQIKYLMQYIDF